MCAVRPRDDDTDCVEQTELMPLSLCIHLLSEHRCLQQSLHFGRQQLALLAGQGRGWGLQRRRPGAMVGTSTARRLLHGTGQLCHGICRRAEHDLHERILQLGTLRGIGSQPVCVVFCAAQLVRSCQFVHARE
jgi:hypothetical protein